MPPRRRLLPRRSPDDWTTATCVAGVDALDRDRPLLRRQAPLGDGFRERALDTGLGTLLLRVPKLRQGSHFPPFLEPRKVSEEALVAVIRETWTGGISTRRVDEL